MRRFLLVFLVSACSLVQLVHPIGCGAIEINLTFDTSADQFPAYDPDGSKLALIANTAADIWKDLLPFENHSYSVTVHWGLFDASSSQLAVYNGFDHSINVRRNNNWFLDPTPEDDSEFLQFTQTLYRDLDLTQQSTFKGTPPDLLETGYSALAIPDGVADGLDDLLSVLLHEMGHFTEIGYNLLTPDVAIQSKFIGGITGVAAEREDESHIAPDNALLDPFISEGVRSLPSALDVIVAANEQSHDQIRLRRVDWLGNVDFPGINLWSLSTAWEGGRRPTTGTEVTIRDAAAVQVSTEPAAARTLLLTEDSALSVQDELHVALDAVLQGSGGFDHPAIAITGAAGLMTVDRNLDISLAHVGLDGGQLHVGGLLILDGELNGANFVNASSLLGHGSVYVGSQLRNRGRVEALGGTLEVTAGPNGDLDLDGNQESTDPGRLQAVSGNLIFHGPLHDAFDGSAAIRQGHSIRFDNEWTFGPDGTLHFDGSGAMAEFYSSEPASHVTFNNSVTVDADTSARVRAGIISFQPETDVTVGNNGVLNLRGNIEYFGGQFKGAGTIQQNGFADVVADTTITVSEYDWDGFNVPNPSNTLIESNATLALRVDSIGGSYRGILSLADHAVLDVQILSNFGVWLLAPDGEIHFVKNGRLTGSPLIAQGSIAVQEGSNHLDAPTTLTALSIVSISDGASLNLNAPVTLGGGMITTASGTLDASRLHQHAPALVLGHHRVNVGFFNWDADDGTSSDTTIQPDAFLDITTKQIGNGLTDPFVFPLWRRGFGDTVDINSGTLGIEVGYAQRGEETYPFSWSLNTSGRMNLNFTDHSLPTVQGSKLINHGTISGSGQFLNEVENDGTIIVGHEDATGTIFLHDEFLQTSDGMMAFELGGLLPGSEFDQLAPQATVSLDGALSVTLLSNYFPSTGDTFRIIDGTSQAAISGTFSQIALPAGDWDVIYGPNYVDLRFIAVPEPATAGLVLGASVLLLRRITRRRSLI